MSDRPQLVTHLPVYEKEISYAGPKRTERLVRTAPGGARAEWIIPGVSSTFRTIKDAEAARRRVRG